VSKLVVSSSTRPARCCSRAASPGRHGVRIIWTMIGSSGRRGGLRSGTNRPRGRTREQLYNEARDLGVEGRSKMNKGQLERAVDAKKR